MIHVRIQVNKTILSNTEGVPIEFTKSEARKAVSEYIKSGMGEQVDILIPTKGNKVITLNVGEFMDEKVSGGTKKEYTYDNHKIDIGEFQDEMRLTKKEKKQVSLLSVGDWIEVYNKPLMRIK